MKHANMEEYSAFVNQLKEDYKSFCSLPIETWKQQAIRNVNGIAAEALRQLVPIDTRRKHGAFFTDSSLALKVLELFNPNFTPNSMIYDSASGAGNLLIAVANYCHMRNTSLNWKKQLLGTDIHTEFVEAAKVRLATNALLNTRCNSFDDPKNINNIQVADGLEENDFYKRATHIFVNPPFNQILPSEKVDWSAGRVSSAALFISKIIRFANPGSYIMAILPDVLRSGSRYEKWRKLVHKYCIQEQIELLGVFDDYADVDVYAIKLLKRQTTLPVPEYGNQHFELSQSPNKIKDLFDVCVGPVVDNRDLVQGPSRPYVVSRGLEGWSVQTTLQSMRRHEGKTFQAPFVVVKRTSRMGDKQRAIATIIDHQFPVYVDNHLIVLTPRSGKLSDCELALEVLQDVRTTELLDQKIRCRHLTVGVIKELPIWPNHKS